MIIKFRLTHLHSSLNFNDDITELHCVCEEFFIDKTLKKNIIYAEIMFETNVRNDKPVLDIFFLFLNYFYFDDSLVLINFTEEGLYKEYNVLNYLKKLIKI